MGVGEVEAEASESILMRLWSSLAEEEVEEETDTDNVEKDVAPFLRSVHTAGSAHLRPGGIAIFFNGIESRVTKVHGSSSFASLFFLLDGDFFVHNLGSGGFFVISLIEIEHRTR